MIQNDPNSTPLQQGLVAWYPFDGNASDMSGNGNHGTVHGASLGTDRHGVANRAYSFDGVDDWIDFNTVSFGGNFKEIKITLSFFGSDYQIHMSIVEFSITIPAGVSVSSFLVMHKILITCLLETALMLASR